MSKTERVVVWEVCEYESRVAIATFRGVRDATTYAHARNRLGGFAAGQCFIVYRRARDAS